MCAGHKPPIKTKSSTHDKHFVPSHAKHPTSVSLHGPCILSDRKKPSSHSVHPSSLSTMTTHTTMSVVGRDVFSTVMKCSSLHVRHESPFRQLAHSTLHSTVRSCL